MRQKTVIRLFFWSVLLALAVSLCRLTLPQNVSVTADKPVTIPIDVAGYGLIFLPARINGSEPMWFALDSGASFPFIVDQRRARKLGLKLEEQFKTGGGAGAGTYEVAWTKGLSINISNLHFADQNAAVIALSSLEAIAGRPLDGVIGSDLFKRYVVEIDYPGNRVSLYHPLNYTYSGDGESIPLTIHDNHLFVSAKMIMAGDRELDGRFLVDTGGGLVTAILTAPFARSRKLPAPNQKTIVDRSLSGLGGQTSLLVARARSFSLGEFTIRDPVIYLSQDSDGALASSEYAGVLGAEILRKFKLVFDYPRGRLFLEPNAYYADPTEYDMSGIRFRAEGNDLRTFRVFQVLKDSPAAAAGIREGDLLDTIDGVPASGYSLDDIYQALKQQGRNYQLRIKRGRETLSANIKMRRLI
jgi:aspartyl protease/PDZ domain-containing protein